MAIMDVVSNKWKLTQTITSGGSITKELNTAGTLIDKNIVIETNAAAASGFSLNVTGIGGTDSLVAGTKASGYYPMTANNVVVSATLSASTPGWFSSGTASDNDTDNVEIGKIIAAAATVSGSATATSPTLARTNTTASGATNVGSANATTTAPTSGYFISAQATAPATTVSLTKTLNTAGYLGSTGEITANNITVAQKAGSVYYIPITPGVAAGDAASVTKITADGSNAGVNIQAVVGSSTTTEPSSGYYVAFQGTGNSKVTTAGWFPTGSLASKTGSTQYFPITTGTVTVAGGELSVPADGNYSGTPTVSISLSSQTTSGITIQDSAPSGYYVKLGGASSALSGTTTVGRTAITLAQTAGYIPAQTAATVSGLGTTAQTASVTVNAGNKTRYLKIPTATFSVSGNGVYCSGGGWVPTGSSSSPLGTITTTSVTQGTSTIASGATSATRGIAQWGTGYITAGSIQAATFANTASNGVTYLDISNVTDSPMLISGDYLYINQGYTDNLKISLAKLVPDWNTTQYPNIAAAGQMLQGYVAYDQDGAILTGTIASFTPEPKYYATTSDQNIATSGKYLTGDIKINKLTSSNYNAANIKHNTTISVYNGSTNVYSVTGTFTSASTVSSGQTAAAAGQILNGYSAWVNGAEVKGNIANGSGITFNTTTNDTNEGKATAGAGYYASAATASIPVATIKSGTAAITSVSVAYNSTNGNYNVTGSANVSAPTVSVNGYISPSKGTRQSNTGAAVLSGVTLAKIAIKSTITGTAKVTPVISKVTTASGNNAINISPNIGDKQTTLPTSGYYVAVQSAAAANTLTATPSVTTAGYGTTTTGTYTPTNDTKSVGANASAVTYIPIPQVATTISGTNTVSPTASVTGNANVVLNTTNNGISVTATGGGTASITATAKVSTAGYGAVNDSVGSATFNAASNTTTASKYIAGVNLEAPSSGQRTFDITVPNGTNDTVTFRFIVDSNSNVWVEGV